MPSDPPACEGSLTTRVYRCLRSDLLRGVLAPGSKLKVQVLGQRYRAGPSPVREALSILSAEGLVERHDQRGFRAAPAGAAEFDELVLARCRLEATCLEDAILSGTDAWAEGVVVARWRLARLPRGATVGDSFVADPAWEAAHGAFHRALLVACPSPTLIGFCDVLRERAERFRHVAGRVAYPGRDVTGEHEAIAEAALRRDAPSAVRLLTAHYHRTAGWLRLALAAATPPP